MTMTETSATTYTAPAATSGVTARPMAPGADLPVLFVVEHDPISLRGLLSDLSHRFGNDLRVRGETSPAVALVVLQELAAAGEPVALLLVDDAAPEFLVPAHELHPSAKRVLLVDRDYTSTSPAVQAMTLGQVDYHIVRPWADIETMYRAVSEYLSSWTREQEPNFEEFRIVAPEHDGRALQLRDVMTRFSMPFGFYPVDSEAGNRLLDEAGLDRNGRAGRDSLRRPGGHRSGLARPRPGHRGQRRE